MYRAMCSRVPCFGKRPDGNILRAEEWVAEVIGDLVDSGYDENMAFIGTWVSCHNFRAMNTSGSYWEEGDIEDVLLRYHI